MSNEVVSTQTGEVVAAQFAPLAVSRMVEMIQYVEEFKAKVLKENVDYGIIPGTKKPTIYKSGAEKLAFGFNLEADYQIVSSTEDAFREWQYTDSQGNTKSAVGYFRYTVKCTLKNKTTGETWGSQLADCDSLERGREMAPSNTILKMAEKRAFNGAVLNATFTSDRFTCDLEDYNPVQRGAEAPRARESTKTSPSSDAGFPSKYGSKDKPNFCAFCGKPHIIAGDMITKNETTGKYGAVACMAPPLTEKDADQEPTGDGGDDLPFDGAGKLNVLDALAKNELIQKAVDIEVAVFGDDDAIEVFRREMVNKDVLSLPNLEKCTKPQLTHYIMALSHKQQGGK